MIRRADQILSGFAEGDAISHEARILQGIFRQWGIASEIYADERHVAPAVAHECRTLAEYSGRSGDLVLHHYSIAAEAVDVFCRSPATKVLVYHNITPADFYRGFDDELAERLAGARTRLPELVRICDAVWAVSAFDAREIDELGIRRARVFPLLFSPEMLDLPPDPRIMRAFRVPMRNVLFVGRMVPNKRVEELMRAFACYHHGLNRQSRLILVGSDRSAPRYYLMLRMLAQELELTTVCFERFASPSGLCAYYRLADLFVTASEHEGYCLPLVEAMYMGVPVIAKNRGGMPEALGGAGILYDEASPQELAVLIHKALEDRDLRATVLQSQTRRITELKARNVEKELKSLLSELGVVVDPP